MSNISLKGIVMEDFINYKMPSMYLITTRCNWKCCHELSIPETSCQNRELIDAESRDYDIETIYNAYKSNDISKAIVFGGLEPFEQFDELIDFIKFFREKDCHDDIVIYTGFYENEIEDKIDKLKQYDNIIVKFGRYIPNSKAHMDDVLGLMLISSNQYAKKIS